MQHSGSPAFVGLRVDVDTYRGTRDGVPALLQTFSDYGIFASFFFTVGPDNMGRHLWRLANPKFLIKMLRSNAASLYGWDILLRGVLWPGPKIGDAFPHIIKQTADAGHEVGLHAWDHHAWQVRLERMTEAEVEQQVSKGYVAIQSILGASPVCSAAAGWVCNDTALRIKQGLDLMYNSDCRGQSIFRPRIDGLPGSPQIPVTLPTYDEIIGRNGVSDDNYNATVLDLMQPEQLNVMTIHAEVEGIAKRSLFGRFLDEAKRRNIHFVPLGDLLPNIEEIPAGSVTTGSIEGRSGRFCVQAAA